MFLRHSVKAEKKQKSENAGIMLVTIKQTNNINNNLINT